MKKGLKKLTGSQQQMGLIPFAAASSPLELHIHERGFRITSGAVTNVVGIRASWGHFNDEILHSTVNNIKNVVAIAAGRSAILNNVAVQPTAIGTTSWIAHLESRVVPE